MVYRNQMRRLLKNKVQLLFLFLFPVVFFSLGLIDESMEIPVALADHDRTPFTKALREVLEQHGMVVSDAEDHEIAEQLRNNKANYGIVIEKGFTEGLLHGAEKPAIHGYALEGVNSGQPVKLYLEQLLQKAVKGSYRDQSSLIQTLGQWVGNGAGDNVRHITVNTVNHAKTWKLVGMLSYSMLFSGITISTLFITDRDNQTLERSMTAPIRFQSYLLQTLGCFFTVAAGQVLFLYSLLLFLVRLDVGNSPWPLLTLLLLFSVVAVSLGVWICSFSRSVMQASVIGVLTVTPVAMVGGAFWSPGMTTEMMNRIDNFVPTSWLLQGVWELTHGGSWTEIGKPSLMMALFALLFILLGMFRKKDISSTIP
jgi:ABC-2 type transport system permease protein